MDSTWATVFKDVVWGCGMLAGGAWVLYRFGLARDHTAHLGIAATATPLVNDAQRHTVHIAIRFENRGKTKLTAKPAFINGDDERTPAYRDDNDTLLYAAGLQLRSLPRSGAIGLLDWYQMTALSEVNECNLLSQFDSTEPGGVDFHLEPGEVVEVGVAAVLEPGHYLARVHFIGPDHMDFWTHTFWVNTAREVLAGGSKGASAT